LDQSNLNLSLKKATYGIETPMYTQSSNNISARYWTTISCEHTTFTLPINQSERKIFIYNFFLL